MTTALTTARDLLERLTGGFPSADDFAAGKAFLSTLPAPGEACDRCGDVLYSAQRDDADTFHTFRDGSRWCATCADPANPERWVLERWDWISRGGLSELVSSAMALVESCSLAWRHAAESWPSGETYAVTPRAEHVDRLRLAVQDAESELLGLPLPTFGAVRDAVAFVELHTGAGCTRGFSPEVLDDVGDPDPEKIAAAFRPSDDDAAKLETFRGSVGPSPTRIREACADLDRASLAVAHWTNENGKAIRSALNRQGEDGENAAVELGELLGTLSAASRALLAKLAEFHYRETLPREPEGS